MTMERLTLVVVVDMFLSNLYVGIQLVLRDYDFTSRPVFTDDDVASMYPLVKHTEYRVSPLRL